MFFSVKAGDLDEFSCICASVVLNAQHEKRFVPFFCDIKGIGKGNCILVSVFFVKTCKKKGT